MSATTAQLTVSRPGPGTLSDNYPITLSLDGEPMARLMAGRAATCELPPGRHRLRANNTLMWKTVEFDVEPGGHVRFVASNRSGAWTTIMAVIGTGWFYLDLTRDAAPAAAPDASAG
jgi:hypothetical protein